MCVSYGHYYTLIKFGLQKDYTAGQLPELIDVIIRNGAALFVCAVGVPPKWAVDKLHAAGIPIMKYVS
jgi:NAD(P)H-dependent flavin oxidoreductase YrpB (nitropropane dioxygenase family)